MTYKPELHLHLLIRDIIFFKGLSSLGLPYLTTRWCFWEGNFHTSKALSHNLTSYKNNKSSSFALQVALRHLIHFPSVIPTSEKSSIAIQIPTGGWTQMWTYFNLDLFRSWMLFLMFSNIHLTSKWLLCQPWDTDQGSNTFKYPGVDRGTSSSLLLLGIVLLKPSSNNRNLSCSVNWSVCEVSTSKVRWNNFKTRLRRDLVWDVYCSETKIQQELPIPKLCGEEVATGQQEQV